MNNSKYIFNNDNMMLLENIITKKVKELVGINVVEQYSEFFYNVLEEVANEVFSKEYINLKNKDVKSSVIYINNIIISETVNFFIKKIDDMMTELPEDLPDDLNSFSAIPDSPKNQRNLELLKTPSSGQIQLPKEVEGPNPFYSVDKEVKYTIESKDCTYNSPEFSHSNLELSSVIEFELLSVFVDNMSFNITETRNNITIDSQEYNVIPGNYSYSKLCKKLSNEKVTFIFDEISSKFSIRCNPGNDVVKVDLSGKNSIHKILGFEKKIYKMNKDEVLTAPNYNKLTNTKHITLDVKIMYEKQLKDLISVKIPVDVRQGFTKFYYPDVKTFTKKCNSIDSIIFSFKEDDGTEYLLRDREFSVSFKIIMKSINDRTES